MTSVWLIGQHAYNINDRKIPFPFFIVPRRTNGLFFKQLNRIMGFHVRHLIFILDYTMSEAGLL